MSALTPAGRDAVQAIANRHGFSFDAVTHMLQAVLNGNGGMAQFNHPEFSGSGQWMRGGMIMTSDMFNNGLKSRIGALCDELSGLVVSQPGLIQTGSFQSQSQGSGDPYATQVQQYGSVAGATGGGLFEVVPDWWGPSLRYPDSTGAQNGVRYAVFSQAARLAVEQNGRVTIYDTLDHRIGGVSQQQSGSATFSFTSQYGLVDLSRLPVVSIDGVAPPAAETWPAPVAGSAPASAPAWPQASNDAGGGDVIGTIERLAALHARGVLSTDEFERKKAELLARL